MISKIIQQIMNLFLDEKDTKSNLILSHIYLLVGFSLPFWISNINGVLKLFFIKFAIYFVF
jgi:hypothetical protein